MKNVFLCVLALDLGILLEKSNSVQNFINYLGLLK